MSDERAAFNLAWQGQRVRVKNDTLAQDWTVREVEERRFSAERVIIHMAHLYRGVPEVTRTARVDELTIAPPRTALQIAIERVEVEDAVRRSRGMMDSSTLGGRARTDALMHRLRVLTEEKPARPLQVLPLQGQHVRFEYRNHRGEVRERRVVVTGVDWGANEWYPEPQFFLRALDVERTPPPQRSFALSHITPGTIRVEHS